MRRVPLLLSLGLALSVAPAAAQAPVKIGYINSQAILDQTPGAQDASQQFEQEMQTMRAELQPAADSLDRLIEQYEAQSLTLSPEAKQRREQEIRTRQQSLQQRASELDQRASARRAELVQPIMDRVSRVIEEMRVEGGYHVIFDVAAGSIIAADESLDLTQEVLRRLQAEAGNQDDGG
jgi:outer membrane protein